ncbi:MAG: ABC transporter ATP-binding protein [Sinomicrobium sp.]|nr:ABC transporter ATP-binding protein [Sinomicrobium sp.]
MTIAEAIGFSIYEGEFVGIVGANGSGKSTLLRTLAGLQPALSGAIYLNRKPLYRYTAAALASALSLVLTEPVPVRNLTVAEIIALGRQPHTNWIGTLSENDRYAIENAMETTKITALRNKRCYELSDGQLQKAMIARALAQHTGLILLDEPTTHLDLYYKAYILKLLKHIVRETQKTVIFSSHEINMAIQLCDKMMVLAENAVYFDTPCRLIEKGAFNSLFPEDFIYFDGQSGSFKVKT